MADSPRTELLQHRSTMWAAVSVSLLLTVIALRIFGFHKDIPTSYATLRTVFLGACAAHLFALTAVARNPASAARTAAVRVLGWTLLPRLVAPTMLWTYLYGYWLPDTLAGAISLWCAALICVVVTIEGFLSRQRFRFSDAAALYTGHYCGIVELVSFVAWASGG